VNPIYEYIIAAIIVILLAGWTYVSMTSSTLVAVNLLDEERLNTVAREVFNKLLFTPGDPVDWNRTTVRSLGLAKMDAGAFTLDRGKVLCLKNGSITVNDARRLLGLEDLYGFSLRITPALNISVSDVSYSAGQHRFNVVVKDLKNLPVATVIVKGYYVDDAGNWHVGDTIGRDSSTTDVDGRAALTFSSVSPQNVMLLITAKSSSTVALAGCYIQSSSDTSCSQSDPPKPLTVEGEYVVEGQPMIEPFTFPSPEPQGGLKTVSLSQYVNIDGYVYEARFRFWRLSQ
jgi:hypothetical protein